jgi:TfoX/Sxy family transcriptional regulator of competence genes
MKFIKSPQKLVEVFETIFPGPPAARRMMFGFPAAFVNDNMFMGLFEEDMILRLPEDSRWELVRSHGAKPFEPRPGRVMTEYVVLPDSIISNREKLRAWIAKSLAYAARIPPKKRKKPKSKAASSKRPKSKAPRPKHAQKRRR